MQRATQGNKASIAAFLLIGSSLVGCSSTTYGPRTDSSGHVLPEAKEDAQGAQMLAMNQPQTAAAGKLTVRAAVFEPSGVIPFPYSDYGQKISPALSWSGAPAGTKAYAIIMEDPDAKEPKPFIHWLLYNLPASETSLRGGLPTQPRLKYLDGVLQGVNSRGSTGWFGPRPPVGDPPHHYHFQLFALDSMLNLEPAAEKKQLLEAMNGHVLAKGEVIGLFQQAMPPRE